ncbi:MAG TPA: DUF6632 domain-containing protein [Anaeromyxobacteraceae bacterium]|nr:DUF6632 domain-containing protein [Anaeromyxobacteraceae bacterium]
MDPAFRLRWLRVVLIVIGILCLAVWPLMLMWPSGWSWHPRGTHSEYMIVIVYAVLGVFLLRAVRDPLSHRSLIWFAAWSSLAHGGLMAWQSFTDASEHGHMLGDVPALLVGGLVLGALMPRGPGAERLAKHRRMG